MSKKFQVTEPVKHPFYLGQPHDEVVYVCKRTGRRRESLKVISPDGQPMDDEREVNLADNLTFESTYSDVVLTFHRTRRNGKGALCYRITKIMEIAPKATG